MSLIDEHLEVRYPMGGGVDPGKLLPAAAATAQQGRCVVAVALLLLLQLQSLPPQP